MDGQLGKKITSTDRNPWITAIKWVQERDNHETLRAYLLQVGCDRYLDLADQAIDTVTRGGEGEKPPYLLGIDIGGTSIKWRLFKGLCRFLWTGQEAGEGSLAATAVRRIVSGRLVTNYEINTSAPVGKALANLIKSAASAKDPLVNYMIWLASEPLLASNPEPGLRWLADNGASTMPLSGILTRKAMRRLCDTGDAARVNQAVEFLGEIFSRDTRLVLAALDALIEGQKGRPLTPTTDTKALFARLNAIEPARGGTLIKNHARQLGALWGDVSAMDLTLNLVGDARAPVTDRIQAVQTAPGFKSDAARETLLSLLAGEIPEALAVEAIRALGELGGDAVPDKLLKHWSGFSPAARSATAEALVTRTHWAAALLCS